MANEAYGGFWYNEVENTSVFCTVHVQLSGSNLVVYPTLYLIEMDTNTKTQIFPNNTDDLSLFTIGMTIDRIERPVITFNKQMGIYNIAMLSFTSSGDVYLHDIDLSQNSKYSAQLKNIAIHTLNMASDTAIIDAANNFDNLINNVIPSLFPA